MVSHLTLRTLPIQLGHGLIHNDTEVVRDLCATSLGKTSMVQIRARRTQRSGTKPSSCWRVSSRSTSSSIAHLPPWLPVHGKALEHDTMLGQSCVDLPSRGGLVRCKAVQLKVATDCVHIPVAEPVHGRHDVQCGVVRPKVTPPWSSLGILTSLR